jgi:hypothetical protein
MLTRRCHIASQSSARWDLRRHADSSPAGSPNQLRRSRAGSALRSPQPATGRAAAPVGKRTEILGRRQQPGDRNAQHSAGPLLGQTLSAKNGSPPRWLWRQWRSVDHDPRVAISSSGSSRCGSLRLRDGLRRDLTASLVARDTSIVRNPKRNHSHTAAKYFSVHIFRGQYCEQTAATSKSKSFATKSEILERNTRCRLSVAWVSTLARLHDLHRELPLRNSGFEADGTPLRIAVDDSGWFNK